MAIEKVLVQDGDGFIHRFLKEGDITTAKNSQSAIALLKENPFDLVICDEIDVLKFAKSLYPQVVVIVVTAIASIENAIEAMRLGAFDYLLKSDISNQLEEIVERAEEHLTFKQEISFHSRGKMEQIMNESSIMKQILSDIEKVSKSHASVFISGESGTGKEVIAHAIHFQSPRSSQPFIKVNCAAIPEALIESEFFGHEKGSFTGAIDKRLGRFELANKGTLLLDEISEIPLSVQAKLLRVVQEQEFERVGGVRPIKVDVRLISTSNRNMKETVEQKLFREDLYYRLNVVPIYLPPLRQRKEDILALARYFLERLCQENHKKIKKFSLEAQRKLLDYHWPGNIRELANIIERTVVMDAGEMIESDHLKLEISCPVLVSNCKNSCSFDQRQSHGIEIVEERGSINEIQPLSSTTQSRELSRGQMSRNFCNQTLEARPATLGMTLAEVEKKHILETLAACKDNRTHAAKKLDISIRTLRNKLKDYLSVSR